MRALVALAAGLALPGVLPALAVAGGPRSSYS